MVIKRFDVWLVILDPTIGSEIKKTRPSLIVSPDVINKYLDTVIAAPLTSTIHAYPTRVNCTFQKKHGQIALDQIRSVDKIRLVRKLGSLDNTTCQTVCELLREIFEY
jgi:mRNA interferase MazF